MSWIGFPHLTSYQQAFDSIGPGNESNELILKMKHQFSHAKIKDNMSWNAQKVSIHSVHSARILSIPIRVSGLLF